MALNADGHMVLVMFVNVDRLQKLSPELVWSIFKIDAYNKKYMYGKDFGGRVLFNVARARILKTNRYTCLACDGALPIYDNRVEINLSPDWKNKFENLNLKKYITVGSNGGNLNRHTIKD